MVQATSGVQSSNTANDIVFNGTAAAGSTDFAQQLATALEGLLQNSGNGSQFEIDIAPSQGQNSDGSQLTVTVKDVTSPTASNSSSPQASSTATSSADTLMSALEPQISTAAQTSGASTTPATTTSTQASTTSTTTTASTTSSSDLSNMTPDDAYWASQPAAVQALRYMPEDQRYYAAEALAQQGYTIDVPIMVDGQDPLATMMQRQADGYTWVPSALQPNIPVGPGISWPGPAYDPNSPPAGAVMVTTDFAAGTNMQDPWISKQDIAASLAGTTS
jgi:hypothetical protein